MRTAGWPLVAQRRKSSRRSSPPRSLAGMGHTFSQVGPQCQPCRGIWADTPGLESVTEYCSPATDRDRRSSPSSSHPGVTQTKTANKVPLRVRPSERDLEGGGRDVTEGAARGGMAAPPPPSCLPAEKHRVNYCFA